MIRRVIDRHPIAVAVAAESVPACIAVAAVAYATVHCMPPANRRMAGVIQRLIALAFGRLKLRSTVDRKKSKSNVQS